MDNNILTSTKKILGLSPGYDAFDHDVITHINAALSTVNQLGVGINGGLFIEDANAVWSDIGAPENQIALVRTYVFLKVGMLFDPPTTSFLLEAKKEQIREYEWRLNSYTETSSSDGTTIVDRTTVIDGGTPSTTPTNYLDGGTP